MRTTYLEPGLRRANSGSARKQAMPKPSDSDPVLPRGWVPGRQQRAPRPDPPPTTASRQAAWEMSRFQHQRDQPFGGGLAVACAHGNYIPQKSDLNE